MNPFSVTPRFLRRHTAVSRWQTSFLMFILPIGLLVAFFSLLNTSAVSASTPAVESATAAYQAGTILYVTTTGSGSACTTAAPCQLAEAMTQAGTEIRVAAGTYTSISSQVLFINRSVAIRGGFTPANWITPDPSTNLTILDGENARPVVLMLSGSGVVLEGFVIQNGSSAVAGGAGVLVNGGNLTLRNNVLHDNDVTNSNNGAAVLVNSSATATIAFNTIYNNTATGAGSLGGAIYVVGTAVIGGNTIYQNSATFGGAIFVAGSNNNTIHSNVIYQNSASTTFGSGGIGFQGTGTLNIWHNTIASNTAANSATGGGGIALFSGTADVSNNIVANNTAVGGSTGVLNAGATVTGSFNNLFNNTTNIPFTNPVNGDPLFVDAPNGNYHLQAASPNINTADPASTITVDFEQQPRPFNGGFDVGADEYYPAGTTCFARLNNGVTDGDVYDNIQTVVDLAQAGNVVKVAGLCTGTGTSIATLNNTVTLRGGYTLTDWSEANRGNYGPTLLDGQNARRLITILGGDATVDSFYLTNGTAVNGPAIYAQAGNPTLQNNTIYANTATNGGAIGGEIAANVAVQFNTIVDNSGDGVRLAGAGGTVQNSILYNNSGTPIVGGSGNGYNLTGVNPLFVDAPNDDYRLTAQSPALDSADPAAVLADDFDGSGRPHGPRADAGADEANSYPSARFVPANINVEVARGTVQNFAPIFENNGTLSGTWSIAVGQVQGWDISYPASIANLQPGANTPFGVVVTVPVSAVPLNPETLTFTATSSVNPNSQATAVIQVGIIPVREIQFTQSYSNTLLPGEAITYTHTLTNAGEFTETVRVRIVSDPFAWGQLFKPDSTPAAGNTFDVVLPSGGVTTTQVVVTVPDFAPAGFANTTLVRASAVADPAILAEVADTVTAKPTVGTRYVATSGNDTNNNCRVSTLPCRTVGRGVSQASVGDEVRIAGGTFTATEIAVNATIDIRGGWNGAFTEQGEVETTISAAGLDRIFNISGASSEPLVELLTLRDGNRTTGGAILVRSGARPTLSQLTFLNNQATRGGALFLEAGTQVLLEKSAFRNNSASTNGGAIFVEGLLNSNNVLLESNTAAQNGGGYYVRSAGTAVIWHNTIHGNSAILTGGGIYLEAGSVALRNSILSSNQAANSGAVHRLAGTFTADYNNVWNNSIPTSNQTFGTHGLAQDPLYTDSFYRVSTISPVLDAGDPASPVDEDFEGNARPSDQGFDMGWYELAGCLAKRNGVVYSSLSEAITVGGASLIQVSGVCRGVNTVDIGGGQLISQTLYLAEDLHIQGGWNSQFNNNPALTPQPTFLDPQGLGRGIYITNDASPLIESIAVLNGDAAGLGGGPAAEDAGGGIYIASGSPQFSQVGVYSSTAELGGGIYNHLGSPEFFVTGTHGTVLDDTAETRVNDVAYNSATLGGGLYNHGGELTLGNTFIRHNQAVDGAGAYLVAGSTGTAANTVLAQNTATGKGGGIYNASNIALWNLTFYANSAATQGGALYTQQSNPVVRNNIFQTNVAPSGPAIFNTTGTPNLGFNYYFNHATTPVVGASLGTGSINSAVAPGLTAPAAGNFHLSSTAAAIDKGDPATPLALDFEEELRPSNQGFDMGADELAGCYARLNGTIYGSPQAALANAAAGDQIDVAGICLGVHTFNAGAPLGVISQTLHIDRDVTFLGGWRDDFSQQDEVTVLDAQGLGRVIYVVPGITATVQGFDIRGGNATVAGGNAHGGGVYANQTQLMLLENRIYNNTAVNGGGVYVLNGTTRVHQGNRIYENSATNGAGVYVEAPATNGVVIYNNFIYGNTASANGGGLNNGAGNNQLLHNTVLSNTAASGGGVYITAGSPTVRSNIFQSNAATMGSGAFGAGGSAPTMGYNTFYLNDAAGTAVGGAGNRTTDPTLLPDYTIDLNSSALNGGDPNSPIAVDFEGHGRPAHQYADMGADEVDGCYARVEGQPTIYFAPQVAINIATAGDTVQIDGLCVGVNQQNVGGPAFQALFVNKELTLDGDWDSGLDENNVLITTMDAHGQGRGLLVTSGISVTLKNLNLTGGAAAVAGYNANLGGAAYNEGQLTLSQMHLIENTAADGAAVYQANSGSLLLERTVATANTATNRGGVVYLGGGTAAVQNNFFYGNLATSGGGAIYNALGNAAVWHNTILENEATNGLGGGIFIAAGSPVVGNNIVDTNTGSGIQATAAGVNIRYNNVVNNSNGNYGGQAADVGGGISQAPLYVNAAVNDYHLQDTSAGVDVGDPNAAVTDDYDGQSRPVNTGFDMGADEVGSCLIRVVGTGIIPTLEFGVLQTAIDYAETNNLTELRVARGECAGVQERNGSFQVGYITEDLTFIGSLARPDFTPTGDYEADAPFLRAPSSRFNALDSGRVLFIAPGANPTFTDIAFVGGQAAGQQGGAIYNAGTTIIYNTAVCQSRAQDGGGIYNAVGASLTMEGNGQQVGVCTVKNIIEAQDGGILSETTLDYDKNQASQNGGAIYNDGQIVYLTGVGFFENTAVLHGGGLYNNGQYSLQNIYFRLNEAGGDGGGVYDSPSSQPSPLNNTAFYQNQAGVRGGGIFHSASTLMSLFHNTFNGNIAPEGGGVYNDHNGLVVNSTIFYNNEATVGTGGGLWSAVAGTLAYNNFFGNLPGDANVGLGTDVILANPQLVGAFTLTQTSAAIDKADPTLLSDPLLAQDIRTIPRPDGGPANANGAVSPYISDIGAYEYIKLYGCALQLPTEQRTIQAGQTTTYTLQLANLGGSTEFGPTGFRDQITVRLDSSTQGWATLIGGPEQTFDLNWQEVQSLQLSVTAPITALANQVDVSIISCQSVSDETATNQATRTTRIVSTPGVLITPDHDLVVLAPGQVITYGHTVTNIGNNTDTFELIASSGPNYANALLVNPDGTPLANNVVQLTAGEQISTFLRVTILNDALAGGLATPGVVVRSTTAPEITDSALNLIQIDYTSGPRYVAQGDTSDEHNNCTVPGNPCATVQHAVNQATAADEVFVAGGLYTDVHTETVGMEVVTQTLFINKPITITGGYSSADEFTTFQPLTNTTTLSGEGQWRVVYVTNGITATLRGLFLANGFDPVQGAGLFNTGGDVTLNGVFVQNNSAKYGAGIYHQAGTLQLYSNVIANNRSISGDSGDGAGLYVEAGTAVLINNTFATNQANFTDSLLATPPTPGNGYGGAFYQVAGELTLLNNILTENQGNDLPDTTPTSAFFVDLDNTNVISYGFNLYNLNMANVSQDVTDITANPLFADAFFHLSDISPAIDVGTAAVPLVRDIDGEPRSMGISVDMGADELLQVPDFTFEPPFQSVTIDSGETYTYFYTLTNTGDVLDSYTILRNSTTTGGTGWAYQLPINSVPDLAVGQAVTIPLIITGGSPGYVDTTELTAVSTVDPTLTRVVTAETTITQIPGVLIAPDQTGMGIPSQVIVYNHTLTNTGNGPDQFTLTVAQQLPAGWLVTITPETTAIITPTGSTPITVTVTVAADAWAGVQHTAVIQAASAYDPTVTDSVTDTTTVMPSFGLMLDPTAATYTSPAGAVAVYTHTLTNLGNVTETVDVSAATGSGPAWTVGTLIPQVTLPPFGAAEIQVTVDVPAGSTGLTHTMLVTATSAFDANVQATAVNTTTVQTINGVILQPDRTGNANAGQTAVYAHTLTNSGNTADSFTFATTSSQGWGVTVQPASTGTLAAGQSIPVTVTVAVPAGTPLATVDIATITATSVMSPTVSDVVTDTTTVVDQPRGVIIAPDNSRATLAGQTIFYYHTVTNTGTLADSYTLTFASSEGWTVQLLPQTVNLAAGQSRSVEVQVQVPGGAAVNTVDTLVITATSGFDAAVFDTATDTTTVTNTITAALALTPDNVDSGTPSTLMTYYHTLTNLGNMADTITLQANGTPFGWVAAAVPTFVTLNPGEQAAVTVTVSIPATAVVGQVETTVVRADSSVDTNVLTTADDVTTVIAVPTSSTTVYLPVVVKAATTTPPTPTPTFTPTPSPTTPATHTPVCIQPSYGNPQGLDLVVTAVEAFPNTPGVGQPVTIRVTIRNQGTTSVAVGNNFYLDAYFNRLPAFASAGDLAWGVQGADLAAGATRVYEASYTFGAPGDYWLYAQVDTDNTVAEVNETNNQLGGCTVHLVTVSGTALTLEGTPTAVPDAGQPRQTPTPVEAIAPTDTETPEPTSEPAATATLIPIPATTSTATPTPDDGAVTIIPAPTMTPSPTVVPEKEG